MPLPILPSRDPKLAAIRRDNRDPQYGAGFMQANRADHGPASVLFGEVLWTLFRPAAAVDFGCAWGGTLWALQQRGCRIRGLDGSPAAQDFAREVGGAPLAECIDRADLNEPPTLSGYDLAISIEVLEHLRPESADAAVRAIAGAAPLAVVTACPPVGRNPLHLNERPWVEWVERFAAAGHTLDPQATDAVKACMRAVRVCTGETVPTWFTGGYIGVFRRSVVA